MTYLAQLLTGPDHHGRVIALYTTTGAVVGAVETHQLAPADDIDAVRAYIAAATRCAPDEVAPFVTLPGLTVTRDELRHWLTVAEHKDARLHYATMYPHRAGDPEPPAVCAYHRTRASARAYADQCAPFELVVAPNPLVYPRTATDPGTFNAAEVQAVAVEASARSLPRFIVGAEYQCRLVTDHSHVLTFRVVDRTPHTVYLTGPHNGNYPHDVPRAFRVKLDRDGAEYVKPWGSYSMAPFLRASSPAREVTPLD